MNMLYRIEPIKINSAGQIMLCNVLKYVRFPIAEHLMNEIDLVFLQENHFF